MEAHVVAWGPIRWRWGPTRWRYLPTALAILALAGAAGPSHALAGYQGSVYSNWTAFNPCLGIVDSYPEKMRKQALAAFAGLGFASASFTKDTFTKAKFLSRTAADWADYVHRHEAPVHSADQPRSHVDLSPGRERGSERHAAGVRHREAQGRHQRLAWTGVLPRLRGHRVGQRPVGVRGDPVGPPPGRLERRERLRRGAGNRQLRRFVRHGLVGLVHGPPAPPARQRLQQVPVRRRRCPSSSAPSAASPPPAACPSLPRWRSR